MLKKFVFADLDDTLFQSRRKCPPNADAAALTAMATLRDGTEHSFATVRQSSLLQTLQREADVIPVTARTLDAFRRVRLHRPLAAVVDYGGLILDAQGKPEPAWLARSREHAADCLPTLQAVQQALQDDAAQQGVSVRVRIMDDCDVPFYVGAKSVEGRESDLDGLEARLRQRCTASGWSVHVHRNGTNLAVLPHWLDKRPAVEHLIERFRRDHGDIVTIGMGDSRSDWAFMHACDYALLPRASQIACAVPER